MRNSHFEVSSLDNFFFKKPTIIFKSPKAIQDEDIRTPEGYKKIVEEDTGIYLID